VRLQKDKHCTLVETQMSATAPFVKGPMQLTLQVPNTVPTAFMSVQLYFKCEGQGENEYCAISDNYRASKKFFATEVIDSVSTSMMVVTLIMAFVGPAIYLTWIVYDKCIKKLV